MLRIAHQRLTSDSLFHAQLYLDMQFVMIFSSQGRYLSRHLHQAIKNIIGRAIDAVAATGLDPNRYIYLALA